MSPTSCVGNESESSNELFAVTWLQRVGEIVFFIQERTLGCFGEQEMLEVVLGVFRNNLLRFAFRMKGNMIDSLGWLGC